MRANGGMFTVPVEFRSGPFETTAALAAGIPRAVVFGPQFVRIHHGVRRHREHEMSFADRLRAARLALPSGARTTGITRLQELGLDHGPREPLHFVVEGDLHLVPEGVFLHRTVLMPSCGDLGVSVEAAFVAHCAETGVLDAIKVGSWLLHTEMMDAGKLEALLDEQPWRRGAAETRWVLPWLDARCRSLPEAELLCLVRGALLPEPAVNETMQIGPSTYVTPDLWWRVFRRAVEYEGRQHQEDRGQYNSDIDRYRAYRKAQIGYLQVTSERMSRPRLVVREIYRELAEGGYEGPPPSFGEQWEVLFRRCSDAVRPQRPRRAGRHSWASGGE